MFYFHEVIKGNKPVLRMANVKPEPIAPPVAPPKSRNQSTTSTGRNLSKIFWYFGIWRNLRSDWGGRSRSGKIGTSLLSIYKCKIFFI